MNFYKKWVICKKIIQEKVSIYETCERDIVTPNIHRFPWVDGLSTGPSGLGRHNLSYSKSLFSLIEAIDE